MIIINLKYYEIHRYKKTTRTLAEEVFDKIKDSQAKKDVEYQISKDEQSLENVNEIPTKQKRGNTLDGKS